MLQTIIECNVIPRNRDEIPSPEIALQYPHLRPISQHVSKVMKNIEIELFIDRDISAVHYVLDQKRANDRLPFAQKLPLG